jgi:hypothetical protein
MACRNKVSIEIDISRGTQGESYFIENQLLEKRLPVKNVQRFP